MDITRSAEYPNSLSLGVKTPQTLEAVVRDRNQY